MSTVMSQPPPKEDEEEDDEEQGEEFVFEDSTDEERPQEDPHRIACDSAAELSKEEARTPSDRVSGADVTEEAQHLLAASSPAGQELTKDLTSLCTAGRSFSACRRGFH